MSSDYIAPPGDDVQIEFNTLRDAYIPPVGNNVEFIFLPPPPRNRDNFFLMMG